MCMYTARDRHVHLRNSFVEELMVRSASQEIPNTLWNKNIH
jgi:hypothetical protein